MAMVMEVSFWTTGRVKGGGFAADLMRRLAGRKSRVRLTAWPVAPEPDDG
jgi:hypothetical protein